MIRQMISRTIGILFLTQLFNIPICAQIHEEEETDSLSVSQRVARSSTSYYDDYFNVGFTSPNSAELARYADIPVNYNTGIPNISIPLYTIQSGDITLPISLSYHAGGITVDQVASWVGLGWSLNAGGVINKTQLDSRGDVSNVAISRMTKEWWNAYARDVGFNRFDLNGLLDYTTTKSVPDLFSYNFIGHSGKMLVNSAGVYDLHGSCELKFKYLYSGAAHNLSAIDLKGYEYTFGVMENTRTSMEHRNKESFSPWSHVLEFGGESSTSSLSFLLTKMKSPSAKDSVTLNYRIEKESYKTMANASMSLKGNVGVWGCNYDEFNNPIFDNYINADTYSSSQKITTIIASNGIRIVFVADHSREDLVSAPFTPTVRPKALSRIEIYNQQNILIKKWVFEYDYFVSYPSHPQDEWANKRLKLKTLKEYGKDNSSPRIYDFSYYGENGNEPRLPFRGAFAGRDFMGYCNSYTSHYSYSSYLANVNSSFPNASQSEPLFGQYLSDNIVFSAGRNLNPNKDYTHAYSLKEIVYPTGGKRIFEYEPHQASGKLYGGLRIKRITNHFTDTESTVKEYEYGIGIVTNPVDMFRKRPYDSFLDNPQGVDKGVNLLYMAEYHSVPIYSIYNTPRNSLSYYTGSGIKYQNVIEKNGDISVEYTYYGAYDDEPYPMYSTNRILVQVDHHIADYPELDVLYNDEFNTWLSCFNSTYISPDFRHGHMKDKTIFTDEGLIIRESYEYDFENRDTLCWMEAVYGAKAWGNDGYTFYDIGITEYITGKAKLREKVTSWYTTEEEYYAGLEGWDAPKYIKEQYEYNAYDLLGRKEIITSSPEENESVEYRYIPDMSTTIYQTMKSKRMIDYPVEEIKKVGGKVTEGSLMTYKNFNGVYLPEKVYLLETSSPLNSYQYYIGGTVTSTFGDAIGLIIERNAKGKIAQIRNKEYQNVVYLWGYNNMYPIAEIKNATYTQVKNKISVAEIEAIAARSTLTSQDLLKLESLKTISGAHVTLMTYEPQIGIKSICAPNDETIYYDYNNFGELKETYKMKDGIKKILETNDYNYSND